MRYAYLAAIGSGLFSAIAPGLAHAEITILDKDKQGDRLLAPLSVSVGGSIRPEWIWTNGPNPNKSDSRGHDGGTRFRFNTDYALSDRTSIIAQYE